MKIGQKINKKVIAGWEQRNYKWTIGGENMRILEN